MSQGNELNESGEESPAGNPFLWPGNSSNESLLLRTASREILETKTHPAATQVGSDSNELLVGVGRSLPDWPLLAAMLMFLAAGSLLLRHWRDSLSSRSTAGKALRTLETLSLGARGSLVLIECGRQRALVGCDLHGVRSISVLPEAFEDNLLELDAVTTSGQSSGGSGVQELLSDEVLCFR
jgi:flagellar biogenesis protein FliO